MKLLNYFAYDNTMEMILNSLGQDLIWWSDAPFLYFDIYTNT
jgi:hypothetical protein